MNDEINRIIQEYIAQVNDVCQKLLDGINEQEHLNLRCKKDFFKYRNQTKKMEFYVNDIIYQLHGNGCFAIGKDFFLNWNFGYRSHWCGVDPWLLGMTLMKNKSKYVAYYDGQLLKRACEQSAANGEMYKKNGLYYYSIPLQETFLPVFPKEYDTLVIEHYEKKWMLPRSKMIDRFLRKSTRIDKQIYQNDHTYVLKFLLNSREIYVIPYDDICYPQNAVKIMTDTIIRDLENGTESASICKQEKDL